MPLFLLGAIVGTAAGIVVSMIAAVNADAEKKEEKDEDE